MIEHRKWESVDNLIREVKEKLQGGKLSCLFEKCYANTLHTTVREHADGGTYVITGDIPANVAAGFYGTDAPLSHSRKERSGSG